MAAVHVQAASRTERMEKENSLGGIDPESNYHEGNDRDQNSV